MLFKYIKCNQNVITFFILKKCQLNNNLIILLLTTQNFIKKYIKVTLIKKEQENKQ